MEKLLGTKEAAEYLGMTERYLQAARNRGYGPAFIRIAGNRVRYRPEDLRDFVAERRVVPPRKGGSRS